MSRFRQPFAWEPPLDLVVSAAPWSPPVVLPQWAGGSPETPNARRAIDDIARRYLEEHRQQGNPNYTFEQGLEEGRKCAVRHDRNNR